MLFAVGVYYAVFLSLFMTCCGSVCFELYNYNIDFIFIIISALTSFVINCRVLLVPDVLRKIMIPIEAALSSLSMYDNVKLSNLKTIIIGEFLG